MFSYLLFILASSFCTNMAAELVELMPYNPGETTAHLVVKLDDKQTLLHDSIHFSTDNPALSVTAWHSKQAAQSLFDPLAHTDRLGYQGTIELTVTLAAQAHPIAESSTLFFHYMTTSQRHPQEQRFMLPAEATPTQDAQMTTSTVSITQHPITKPSAATAMASCPQSLPQIIYEGAHKLIHTLFTFFATAKQRVSTLLTSTSSRALQLLLAFLLGVLMSLTPCIYPMIPVTVGLLGTSSGQSFFKNFLLALSYTLGLALTFAGLGFFTVLFGSQCGRLACNPWVIILLVLFLAYSAGSMLGWYELYIPRIFRPSTNVQRGSYSSAFLFGSASGLIASPCMSPGLALILSVVATLGNYFLGFLLLFTFGVGSSMPLLLIGTFSSSLHLFPRAGLWMNEVKKFFGFMLFMMCFYYLQVIMPLHMALWGAAFFVAVCGIIYAVQFIAARSRASRLYAFLISVTLLSAALYTAYVGTMAWHASQHKSQNDSSWLHHYDEARVLAQEQKKLLLLDFTASWCSLCVLLDKEVLQHTDVAVLFDKLIAVKIDGTSSRNEQYTRLAQQFAILGLPTLILIDPTTQTVLHRWNSELLEQTPQSFAQEVLQFVEKAR